MKKLTVITIAMAMIMLISACGQTTAVTQSTPTPSAVASFKAKKLADTEAAIIADYLAEYKSRDVDSFLKEEECRIYEEKGYRILSECAITNPTRSNEELYYPILFENTNGDLVVVGINKYGNLDIPTNDLYTLHSAGAEVAGECIMNSPDAQLYYDSTTGIIQYWEFGEKTQEFNLPIGSLYCGHSYWEGYIFRHNTDVYSVLDTNGENTIEPHVIAHNVKMVIDTDYSLTSDCFSQPLFLMNDGSIKCYVGWNGDESNHDDITHLADVSRDGGYEGSSTYYPYNQ